MKKSIRIILTVIMLCGIYPYQTIFSEEEPVSQLPKTVDEVIQKINHDMRELYGFKESEYYKDHIMKNNQRLNLRKDLIRDRLNRASQPSEKLEEKKDQAAHL